MRNIILATILLVLGFASLAKADMIAFPIADAGGPYSIHVGDDLNLNGRQSTDPDIANGDYIKSYSWFLDYQATIPIAGSYNFVTIYYQDLVNLLKAEGFNDPTDRQHVIGLTVTDSTNRTNTDYATLLISPNLPDPAPVPEPGTMMLLGIGLGCLAIFGKRRMNKEA